MSKSELHDWECAIEKLSSDNADKMLAIAQDIYNTAFVRGKNYISLEQQPCEDCVSRDEVLKDQLSVYTKEYGEIDVVAVEYIESLPSVTPSYNSINTELKPCEDCISRKAVMDGIDRYIEKVQSTGAKDDFISFQELVVKQLPSVTPIRPYGHWITNSDYPDKLICSECDNRFDMWWMDKGSNYCPSCGSHNGGGNECQ